MPENEETKQAAFYSRGVYFTGSGDDEQAVECFKAALSLDPNYKAAAFLLGRSLHTLKRNVEAEEVYRRALINEPNNAFHYVEFAHVLTALRKIDEAEEVFKKAVSVEPDNTVVLGQAGYFHQNYRNPDEAVDLYQRYLEHLPDDVSVLTNIGIIKGRLGPYEEAENHLLRALELTETPSRILNHLAGIQSHAPDSLAYLNRALDDDPTYAAARTNKLNTLNHVEDITQEELYQAHQEWQRWHVEPLPAERLNFRNLPDPNKKIRIGYLSGDFCGHVVSYFIEGALRCHDRNAFEIYCYANVAIPDETTARLQSYGHQWRSVVGVSASDAADMIRHDGIDILVDLNGYTNRYRMDITTKKPAPIQVAWIGYPNTLGLEAVDYRFVDFITDPPGSADTRHSEVLWRLPGCFLCYTTTSGYPYSKDLNAKKTGEITFASFNRVIKITDSCLDAWARILARVDHSKLVIKSSTPITGPFRDRVYTAFGTYEIDKNRVEFIDRLPAEESLELYGTVDLALDTFPYNGTTTTCECMWMGVPVICLTGDRHATRVSASLLTQVGLEEFINTSVDEYVECAVKLASDIEGLAVIRNGLRERMLASPLCDARTHTANLEASYRKIWKAWCDSKQHEQVGHTQEKPTKPPIRIIHGFSNLVFNQLIEHLKAMGGVNVLSDMHPLGMAIFDPVQQAQDQYGLFNEQDWEVVSRKKLSFGERLSRVQEAGRRHNQSLVITDWNHLDFIAKPYLPQAGNKLATNLALEQEFEIMDVFFLRHPLPQWLYYCANSNVNETVTIEEFLAGYRRFIEAATEGAWFRCEDFAKNPGAVLEKICRHLQLQFDPGFAGNSVTEIAADIPFDFDPGLSTRMAQSEDYVEILRLMRYDPE